MSQHLCLYSLLSLLLLEMNSSCSYACVHQTLSPHLHNNIVPAVSLSLSLATCLSLTGSFQSAYRQCYKISHLWDISLHLLSNVLDTFTNAISFHSCNCVKIISLVLWDEGVRIQIHTFWFQRQHSAEKMAQCIRIVSKKEHITSV